MVRDAARGGADDGKRMSQYKRKEPVKPSTAHCDSMQPGGRQEEGDLGGSEPIAAARDESV